jgi:thiamine kinase-like enzyme
MTDRLIETLLHDDPIPVWLGADQNWTRVYGRTAVGNSATLVYEPDSGSDGSICVQIGVAGEAVGALRSVSSFNWWHDPALPALSGLRARHPRLRPVRYRPGKRCTLKLENQRPLFIKCVADDRGCAINADARLLNLAQKTGQLGFAVARPAGWLPSLKIIAQHMVAGQSIVPRIWNDADLAQRLGEANATIAATSIRPAARFSYGDQMKRTAKYSRRLIKRLPGSQEVLADLLDRLERVTPGHADRPIHGAPHAHQWLDGPDGLALVDFDRFSLGDPELDVATFVAEADFEDAAGARKAAQIYAGAFAARCPLNADLLRAYRVHKHIAKAMRSASAIRSDFEDRALAILTNARVLLG